MFEIAGLCAGNNSEIEFHNFLFHAKVRKLYVTQFLNYFQRKIPFEAMMKQNLYLSEKFSNLLKTKEIYGTFNKHEQNTKGLGNLTMCFAPPQLFFVTF